VANGDKEIWELLLKSDKNKNNFDKSGQRKRSGIGQFQLTIDIYLMVK
jgi:hypothetical protein